MNEVVQYVDYTAKSKPHPSLPRKVRNFSRAVKDETVARFKRRPVITREEVERRKTICQNCVDWFDPKECVCTHPDCGCPTGRKARWRGQKCPVGKW